MVYHSLASHYSFIRSAAVDRYSHHPLRTPFVILASFVMLAISALVYDSLILDIMAGLVLFGLAELGLGMAVGRLIRTNASGGSDELAPLALAVPEYRNRGSQRDRRGKK